MGFTPGGPLLDTIFDMPASGIYYWQNENRVDATCLKKHMNWVDLYALCYFNGHIEWLVQEGRNYSFGYFPFHVARWSFNADISTEVIFASPLFCSECTSSDYVMTNDVWLLPQICFQHSICWNPQYQLPQPHGDFCCSFRQMAKAIVQYKKLHFNEQCQMFTCISQMK